MKLQRGLKEYWEAQSKQKSLLEELGSPMTAEARADLLRTTLKDIGVGYIIKNDKVYKV